MLVANVNEKRKTNRKCTYNIIIIIIIGVFRSDFEINEKQFTHSCSTVLVNWYFYNARQFRQCALGSRLRWIRDDSSSIGRKSVEIIIRWFNDFEWRVGMICNIRRCIQPSLLRPVIAASPKTAESMLDVGQNDDNCDSCKRSEPWSVLVRTIDEPVNSKKSKNVIKIQIRSNGRCDLP